jgi:hypothetical protein
LGLGSYSIGFDNIRQNDHRTKKDKMSTREDREKGKKYKSKRNSSARQIQNSRVVFDTHEIAKDERTNPQRQSIL